MKTVSERLKYLRESQNLSQEQLVEIMNKKYGVKYNRSSISRWESGIRNINRENLNCYANYFNVSLDWLVFGNNIDDEKIDQCTIEDVNASEFYLVEHKGKMIKFYIKELDENEKEELKEFKKNGALAFNNEVSKEDTDLLENVLTEIYLKSKLGK